MCPATQLQQLSSGSAKPRAGTPSQGSSPDCSGSAQRRQPRRVPAPRGGQMRELHLLCRRWRDSWVWVGATHCSPSSPLATSNGGRVLEQASKLGPTPRPWLLAPGGAGRTIRHARLSGQNPFWALPICIYCKLCTFFLCVIHAYPIFRVHVFFVPPSTTPTSPYPTDVRRNPPTVTRSTVCYSPLVGKGSLLIKLSFSSKKSSWRRDKRA